MLSGVVYFPTADEYAQATAQQKLPEFINPDSLRLVNGVVTAHCDIVLETA